MNFITNMFKKQPKFEPKEIEATKYDPQVAVSNIAMASLLGGTELKQPKYFQMPKNDISFALRGTIGVEQSAIAQDANIDWGNFVNTYGDTKSEFKGFQYLAQLSQVAEYRTFSDVISGELTREFVELRCNDDRMTNERKKRIHQINEDFKHFRVLDVIKTACAHDTFFGRGQILINLKPPRGDDLSLPLMIDEKSIPVGSLDGFVNVEPMWTTPLKYNASNPIAKDFYKPSSWYMLGQAVHSTRLITIITRPLPDILKPVYNFAGMSLSQLAEPYVNGWIQTRDDITKLINAFSMVVFAADMTRIMGSAGDYSALTDFESRIKMFRDYRNNLGIFCHDKEREELKMLNVPLSHLDKLQAQKQEQMCSVSRIPAVLFTGQDPAGLNPSTEGSIKNFKDTILSMAVANYQYPIEVIKEVIELNRYGNVDKSIYVHWKPLYTATQVENADIHLKRAQRDSVYLSNGVISPEEVRAELAASEDSDYNYISGKSIDPEYQNDTNKDKKNKGDPNEVKDGQKPQDKKKQEDKYK